MNTKRDYRLHYVDMYPQPVLEPATMKSFLLSTRLKVYAAVVLLTFFMYSGHLPTTMLVAVIGAFILWCMEPKA